MSPNHHQVILPLLRMLADGRVRTVRALFNGFHVRARVELKGFPFQRRELISVCQIREACACLERACFVQRLSRRRCRITLRGRRLLRCKVESTNLRKGRLCALLSHALSRQERVPLLNSPPSEVSAKRGVVSRQECEISNPCNLVALSAQALRTSSFVHSHEQRLENPQRGIIVGESLVGSRCNHTDAKLYNSTHEPPPALRTPPKEGNLEAMENLSQSLRGKLTSDLLKRLKLMSPSFFERLVLDVLVAMGYGGSRKSAAQIMGRSGDAGVDGTIKEDALGLDVIYIQAKRWENPVGRPEVQAFAGSLEGFRAKKGVFITTSRFTWEALDYVERISQRIALINGPQLSELMMDYGVGTIDHAHYTIKRLDMDYFNEHQAMA